MYLIHILNAPGFAVRTRAPTSPSQPGVQNSASTHPVCLFVTSRAPCCVGLCGVFCGQPLPKVQPVAVPCLFSFAAGQLMRGSTFYMGVSSCQAMALASARQYFRHLTTHNRCAQGSALVWAPARAEVCPQASLRMHVVGQAHYTNCQTWFLHSDNTAGPGCMQLER